MTSDLRPYSDYKDSGLPWLGRVPKHWDVRRAKYLFRCIDVISTTGSEELLAVSAERGVVPRSSMKVTMFKAESYVGHKLCWPNDLVINSLWAWARGLGVTKHHGIISSAYGVYRLRPRFERYADFIHHLVRSAAFHWELRVRSKGVWTSRLQLTDDAFLGVPIPLPSPEESDAMVQFVTLMDRRVNRFIRNRRRLIEVLNEQKQAIINRAVTRGLDPNVRLKPSGIEWLGEIPEHWEVKQLRFVLQGGLSNGLFKTKDKYGRGVPLVNVKDIYQVDYQVQYSSLERVEVTASEGESFTVAPGDIFFVRSSLKLEGTGRSAFVDRLREATVFECHLVRGRPDKRQVLPRFLVYLLNSASIHASLVTHANTVTMSTLPQGEIASQRLPIPPMVEQSKILEFIDRGCAAVFTAISKAEREIELIREYRTRLITDVVTGKLDVRHLSSEIGAEPAEPMGLDEDIDYEELTGDEDPELDEEAPDADD